MGTAVPIEFLLALDPALAGQIRSRVAGPVPCQVHPYYYGFTNAEVADWYRGIEAQLCEFGESPQKTLAEELRAYNEYLARRARYVASLRAPFGVLFEESPKVARTIARLREENPRITWLAVRTGSATWKLGLPGREEAAWAEVSTKMQALGMADLAVFGAMSGNLGRCVTETARSLRASGLFRSVDIVGEASFGGA